MPNSSTYSREYRVQLYGRVVQTYGWAVKAYGWTCRNIPAVTQHFVTVPVIPIPWSWRTSTVKPTCFTFMKKLSLCPSSWEYQFPFVPFPTNILFFPVYKIGANDLCSPRADMQGLTLSRASTGVTEICLSCSDPLLESFLNKELKLPALEASEHKSGKWLSQMESRMSIWAPFPYKDGTTSRDKTFSHEKRNHLPSIHAI